MTDEATTKVLVTDTGTASKIEGAGTGGVEIVVVNPISLLAVRVLRTYVQTLLGILTIAALPQTLIQFKDFTDLLIQASVVSLAPALISLLQNVLEVLAKLDQTKPELRG